MKITQRAAGTVAVILMTSASSAALAQAQGAAAPAAPASSPAAAGAGTQTVGEVIVTAQRREQRLSRTPVAVTALSGATLERAHIDTQADLQIAVPGLTVKASTSSNDLNFAIRGQSLDAFSGGRPGVLPYFNEVQIGGQGTSSSFYDLQSVQVLKGPQGTLFGRNSTGGAVLFTSRPATNDVDGYVSVSGGDYSTYNAEGAFNAPLVKDKLFLRVAGVYATNDGYQTNLFNGEKLGGSDREGVRASLRWDITNSIRNDLVVDYYHASGTSMAPVLSSINPNSLVPGAALYSNAQFPAGAAPATGPYISDYVVSQFLQAGGVPTATANSIANGNYLRYINSFNKPIAVPVGGLAQVLTDQQARGPYSPDTNTPDLFHTQNIIVTNTTAFDLHNGQTVKNIFGYTNLQSFNNSDDDGTPFSISDTTANAAIGNTTNANQLSEEIQLSGKILDSKLNYVTGFYFSSEGTYSNLNTVNLDILGGGRQELIYERNNTTYAAYAQGTYDLRDFVSGLSFTAGLRLAAEKIEDINLPGDSNHGLAATSSAYSNDQSRTVKNVPLTVGVQEQLNPNLLLYVTSHRSYKNGGYNGQAAPKIGGADINGSSYRTETVTDVEVGAKFSGVIAQMPTQANLALYTDYIKNSQRTAYLSEPTGLYADSVNVPRAEVQGVEFDTSILPVSWFRLGASVNYTDAQFTNGETAVAGSTSLFATYPDTSKWSGSLFGEATVPLTSDLKGVVHGDMFAQTKQYYYSAENLDPGAILKSYAVTNFRVAIESAHGWSLTANVKNAFNKDYYVGGFPLGLLLGTNTEIPGTPRTFLVTARYNF